MRSPIWTLNIFLIIILLSVSGLLWFSRPKLAKPTPLQPAISSQTADAITTPPDTKIIIERNIFGTSNGNGALPQQQSPLEKPIPQLAKPPQRRAAELPKVTPPSFLPPLEVVVRGIMTSSSEENNRAILSEPKSKEDDLYQVGDTILDAEIVRIMANKVIVVRPNGQMETIFISTVDAHVDPLYQEAQNISHDPVAKQLHETSWMIDSKTFTKRVTSLAHLIDQLDITTAFENNKSIGCRIGEMTPHNIGAQLGLRSGDILLSIDDLPLTSTKERFEAYHTVMKTYSHKPLSVKILRGKETVTLTYAIQAAKPSSSNSTHRSPLHDPMKKKPELLGSNSSATSISSLHKDTKNAMLEYGGKAYGTRKAPLASEQS